MYNCVLFSFSTLVLCLYCVLTFVFAVAVIQSKCQKEKILLINAYIIIPFLSEFFFYFCKIRTNFFFPFYLYQEY